MNIRRALVWITSALVGLVSSVAIIAFFGTTLEKFSLANAVLVFLGMGSVAFIWLDYFLRTQYLRG
jgi:hypothetical protein